MLPALILYGSYSENLMDCNNAPCSDTIRYIFRKLPGVLIKVAVDFTELQVGLIYSKSTKSTESLT